MSIIRSVHWLKNSVQLSTVFSADDYYPSGYFPRTALWADSVSPRTNTIASRDQFKPIRIGENLVVNYNGPWNTLLLKTISKSFLIGQSDHCYVCTQKCRAKVLVTSTNKREK